MYSSGQVFFKKSRLPLSGRRWLILDFFWLILVSVVYLGYFFDPVCLDPLVGFVCFGILGSLELFWFFWFYWFDFSLLFGRPWSLNSFGRLELGDALFGSYCVAGLFSRWLCFCRQVYGRSQSRIRSRKMKWWGRLGTMIKSWGIYWEWSKMGGWQSLRRS